MKEIENQNGCFIKNIPFLILSYKTKKTNKNENVFTVK